MSKNEERYHRLIYSTQDQYMEQWLAGYYASKRDAEENNKNSPDYKKWLEDHHGTKEVNNKLSDYRDNPDYKAWLDGYHGYIDKYTAVRDEYEAALETSRKTNKVEQPKAKNTGFRK